MISERIFLALSVNLGGIQASLFGATVTAFAIVAIFRWWDRRAKRLGRATTPQFVPPAIAAAVYFCWIRFLLPSMAAFDSFDRPSEVVQVTDPEKLLRLIQAQHSAILGLATIIDWTVFVLFLVGLSVASTWLAARTDDSDLKLGDPD